MDIMDIVKRDIPDFNPIGLLILKGMGGKGEIPLDVLTDEWGIYLADERGIYLTDRS